MKGREIFSSSLPNSNINGYGKGKWCAEFLITKAFNYGMNGMIFRPGNIFANTITGITNIPDTNHLILFMESIIKYRKAPDIASKYEFLPVDLVAEMIVKISQNKLFNRACLNLSNPFEITLYDLIKILKEIFNIEIEIIPYEKWIRTVIDRIPIHDKLSQLKLLYKNYYIGCIDSYNTETAQKAYMKNNINVPNNYEKLISEAFEKYLTEYLKIKI